MKIKKNEVGNNVNNKYVRRTMKKFKNKYKEVTFNPKLKSVKIFVPSPNENALYTLRNKIIEKKSIIKRKNRKRKTIHNHISKEKINQILQVDNQIVIQSNRIENAGSSKLNLQNRLNVNDKLTSSNFTVRKNLNAVIKLKILDIYNLSHSFNFTSSLTGINSQTIRYWKKTEGTLKKKAKTQNHVEKSQYPFNIEELMAEAKSKMMEKSLRKRETQTENFIVPLTVNKTLSKPGKEWSTNSVSDSNPSSKMETTSIQNDLSDNIDERDQRNNFSKRKRKFKSNKVNFDLIPNMMSLESIVGEINKLSHIYESQDCLISLDNYFKTLQSGHDIPNTFDNKYLVAKTKLQHEAFKKIISDFFYGEFKLLTEINHQFNQLLRKKSKNVARNLEELKNYFHGSIQRLHVLKDRLP